MLQDQNMHFIIGAHALSLASGDVAAARRLLPAVLRLADYLEANGLATTGIFTSPASGIANGGACAPSLVGDTWVPSCGSSNWCVRHGTLPVAKRWHLRTPARWYAVRPRSTRP